MDTTDRAVHIGSPAFVAGGARCDHQLIDRPKVLLCTLPRFQHLLEAGRPSINTNSPVGDVDVVAKVAGVAVPDELTASDQVGIEGISGLCVSSRTVWSLPRTRISTLNEVVASSYRGHRLGPRAAQRHWPIQGNALVVGIHSSVAQVALWAVLDEAQRAREVFYDMSSFLKQAVEKYKSLACWSRT